MVRLIMDPVFPKRNAQAYWMIHSIVGGFIQTKGTGQGVFFDTKTMKPLVNNEAFFHVH